VGEGKDGDSYFSNGKVVVSLFQVFHFTSVGINPKTLRFKGKDYSLLLQV
jgi:hypothetical protein